MLIVFIRVQSMCKHLRISKVGFLTYEYCFLHTFVHNNTPLHFKLNNRPLILTIPSVAELKEIGIINYDQCDT